MAVKDLLQPRFIIALVALVAVVSMMYVGTIRADVGVTIILGILAAFGAYHMKAPKDKN